MALPKDYSDSVQLLAFVLCPHSQWDSSLLNALSQMWGPLRHTGALYPFDQTHYYQAEMGSHLYRGVLSFESLIDPSKIGDYKKQSNAFEIQTQQATGLRFVNVDVGYMDVDKIVLPSYKKGPFKLYAGEGLWLDMQMTYAKGVFSSTPWAFEDFKRNPYQKDLQLIREKYKKALKSTSKNGFTRDQIGMI